MKVINLKTWERKDFYNCFKKDVMPMYGITTKFDVTNVYNFAKQNGISFYFALGHIFYSALKDVEEFNIRVVKRKLVVMENNVLSFTCIKPNETMFKFVDVLYDADIVKFCENARRIEQNQTGLFGNLKNPKYGVFYSCTPWFEFSAMTNPRSKSKNDFIPRIVWDKIKTENGKKFLNVSIEVNHRIIDGLLISKLIANTKQLIASLK